MNDQIIGFDEYDPNRVLFDRSAIEQINPHRFELSLLDGILFEDLTGYRAAGFHDVPPDPFWARGHFPGRPLMPGVLVCECAAQLCAWFAKRSGLFTEGLIGLGGLEDVRFRHPVQPGDRLVVHLVRERSRPNLLIAGRFRCYVGSQLAVEGLIKGVAID